MFLPHRKGAYMKYLSQFLIIMGFTLAGEALQRLLPLPIPASVYGIALLFLALSLGAVKVHQVKEVGGFLTSILPVLFVAPTVGIVEHWHLIQPRLLPIFLIITGTTFLTFGLSGRLTQRFLRRGGDGND